MLVDATSNGVAGGVQRPFSDEEAAAVTFFGGSRRSTRPSEPTYVAGTAIKLNPDRVDVCCGRTSGLLWHELTHYLLQEHNGAGAAVAVRGRRVVGGVAALLNG